MATTSKSHMEEGASCDWRLVYNTARTFMALGRHVEASDWLRILAIAMPSEFEIWDALAACHDAEEQSDIGDTLRSLGRLLQVQTQLERRPP